MQLDTHPINSRKYTRKYYYAHVSYQTRLGDCKQVVEGYMRRAVAAAPCRWTAASDGAARSAGAAGTKSCRCCCSSRTAEIRVVREFLKSFKSIFSHYKTWRMSKILGQVLYVKYNGTTFFLKTTFRSDIEDEHFLPVFFLIFTQNVDGCC